VDEGEACSTMPNQPFSPGSRLSVWVRGAPCHRGLAHSSSQCPCQSRQHFLPLLAPALAGIHNISQLQTMACLPAPTIWLLWATILTHITNYSKRREGGGAEEGVCRLVFLCDVRCERKGARPGGFSFIHLSLCSAPFKRSLAHMGSFLSAQLSYQPDFSFCQLSKV